MTISKTKLVAGLILAVLAVGSLIGACAPPAETSPSGERGKPTQDLVTLDVEQDKLDASGVIPTRAPKVCPDLDSLLYQVIQSPDPQSLAEQLQLKTKEDKIQVLLVLQDEDTRFLLDYEVEVSKQSGSRVQAECQPPHFLPASAAW